MPTNQEGLTEVEGLRVIVKGPIKVQKGHTEVKGPHAGKGAHEGEGAHRGKGTHRGELQAL